MTATIEHEPSCDDCGDWYVYIDGVKASYGYWSKADAETALDSHLWQNIVVG